MHIKRQIHFQHTSTHTDNKAEYTLCKIVIYPNAAHIDSGRDSPPTGWPAGAGDDAAGRDGRVVCRHGPHPRWREWATAGGRRVRSGRPIGCCARSTVWRAACIYMFGYVERTEKARERERGTPVRDFGATIYRKHVCVYLWVDIGWGEGGCMDSCAKERQLNGMMSWRRRWWECDYVCVKMGFCWEWVDCGWVEKVLRTPYLH